MTTPGLPNSNSTFSNFNPADGYSGEVGANSTANATGGRGGTSFSPAVIAVIVILGAAFLLVSYYTMVAKFCTSRHVFIWRRWRRRQVASGGAPEDDDPAAVTWPLVASQQGLEEALIHAIPVFEYRKKDGQLPVAGGEGRGSECAVCLSEFEEGETVRVLPKCSHAFHLPCIDMWLHSHSNCPLCRANINVTPTATPAPAALDHALPARPPDDTSIAGENAQPASVIDDAAQDARHHLRNEVRIIGENTHGEEDTRLTRLRPLNREQKTINLISRQPHDHVTDGLLADEILERIHLQLGLGFRCFSTGRASLGNDGQRVERLTAVAGAANFRMTRSSSLGFCVDNTIPGLMDEYRYLHTREDDHHQVIDLNLGNAHVLVDTVHKLGSSSSSSSSSSSNDDEDDNKNGGSTFCSMRDFKSKSLNHDNNSELKSLKVESNIGDPLMGRMLLSLKGPRAVKRSFSGGRLFGFKVQKNTPASVGTSSTELPARLPI